MRKKLHIEFGSSYTHLTRSKPFVALIAALIVSGGCQFARQPVTPESRAAAIAEMTPFYECILYHDQTGNQAGVTKSIDDAVTIGEHYGLAPGDIMGIYRTIRVPQEEAVLEKAAEYSAQREGVLPRISGEPIQPNEEEQVRAWESLYGEACS